MSIPVRGAEVLLAPIAVDRRAQKPLYRQVYEGFRDAILEGRIAVGGQLPSTRALAVELGISRLPVVLAFELLVAEGYCEGRLGAGTFVSPAMRARAGSASGGAAPDSARRPVSRAGAAMVRPREDWLVRPGAFRVGDAAFDHFPFAAWKRLAAQQARRLSAVDLRYTDPLGHLPLREAIADYLGAMRGVRCDASRIVVTSGSQQALLVAARSVLDPGGAAWIEEPGYWGVREVLTSIAARVVPVAVDDEGLDVARGVALAPSARAAFVTPSHQFPLGATLSAGRRLQLLDWARRRGSWIVEDDYDSEYRHDGPPTAALHSLDQNRRVLYIGTFSKVLFGALRLGFLVLPEDLVAVAAAVRRSIDISPATFPQAILARFIREGHFGRHLRRMRALYRERRDALVGALRAELGPDAPIRGESAGMHLVLELPRGTNDREVSARMAASGLWTMPLSFCRTRRTGSPGLVLGYGGTDAEALRLGAGKLARELDRIPKRA
jgi:GntR family transcriptional regulator / MocR family aminotransferase